MDGSRRIGVFGHKPKQGAAPGTGARILAAAAVLVLLDMLCTPLAGIAATCTVIVNNVAHTYTLSPSSACTYDLTATPFPLTDQGGNPYSLIMNGTSTATVNAPNTYTNGTLLDAGTLAVSNDNGFGTATGGDLGGTTGALQISGGMLEALASITTARPIVLTAPFGTSSGFAPNGFDLTLSGVISGSGALNVLVPSGILTLSGANTYTGGTFVSHNVLQVSSDSNLGAPAAQLGLLSSTLEFLSGSNFTSTRPIGINLGATMQLDPGAVVTLNGVVSGNGGLTVAGPGVGAALILGGANTYTGGTTLNTAILQISQDSNLGDPSGGLTMTNSILNVAGTVTSARPVTLNGFFGDEIFFFQNDSLTLTGVVSGSGGGLIVAGAGTLTLSGTNTYTGGTVVEDAATVAVSSDSNLGTGAAGLTLDGGTLEFLNGFATARPVTLGAAGGTFMAPASIGIGATLTGVVSGSGALTATGPLGLTLTGVNTYTGGTTASNGGLLEVSQDANLGAAGTRLTLDSGGLVPTASFSSPRPITLGGQFGEVLFPFSGTALTLSGSISGPGELIVLGGPGTLTLSGANTYTGGTLVDNATVQVSQDANLGASSGRLTLESGGVLDALASFTSNRSISLAGGGQILMSPGVSLTLNGVVTGTGGLSVSSLFGTLTLAGANTYTGGTVVDHTTLDVSSDSNLGDSGGALILKTASLDAVGTFTSARNITLSSFSQINPNRFNVTLNGVVSGSGGLTVGNAVAAGGTLTLNGANTYTGGTLVEDQATLAVSSNSNLGDPSGGLTLSFGTLEGLASFTSDRSVFTSGGRVLLQPQVALDLNGVVSGFDLTLAGAGTLVLNGVNTYSAGTTVSGGTLEVGDSGHPGASILGPLAVQSGGTLSGHGTVNGAVTNNGTVSPGGTIGTLTVGTYTQGAAGILSVEISPAAASELLVTGAGTLGGDLNLAFDPGAYVPNRYVLLKAGSLSGTFAGITQDPGLPTPLLVPQVSVLDGTPGEVDLALVFNPAGFTNAASTPNQQAVAGALQGIVAAAGGNLPGGDLGTVIGAMLGLGTGDLRRALDALGGVLYTAVPTAAVEVGQDLTRALLRHIDAIDTSAAGGSATARAAGSNVTALAAAGPATQDETPPAAGAPSVVPSSWDAAGAQWAGLAAGQGGGDDWAALAEGLAATLGPHAWLEGYGAGQTLAGDGNAPGFTSQTFGVLGGYAWPVSDRIQIGLAGAWTHTNLTLNGGSGAAGSAGLDLGEGWVYGRYDTGQWWGDLVAGYEWNSGSATRPITVGALSRTATGGYSGNGVVAAAEVGTRVAAGTATLLPTLGLQYLQANQGALVEQGAGSISLNVGSAAASSLQANVGVGIAKVITTGNGTPVRLEGRVGYLHEFGTPTPGVVMNFAGGGPAFTILGVTPSRDLLQLEGRVAAHVADRVDLAFDAGLLTGGNLSDTTGDVSVVYHF